MNFIIILFFIILILFFIKYALDFFKNTNNNTNNNIDNIIDNNIDKTYTIDNNDNNIDDLYKETGILKLEKHFDNTDIIYLNNHLKFIEENYFKFIKTSTNNGLINNIDRLSIKVTPSRDKPYDVGKDEYLNIINERENKSNNNLIDYNKRYGKINNKKNIITNKLYSEYETNDSFKNYLDKRMYYDSYMESKESNKFIEFITKIVINLSKKYPKIVDKDFRIQWSMILLVLPGAIEQEIHKDDWYYFNTHEKLVSQQIIIPLHDTPIEMGPTIAYKQNLISNNILNKFNYDKSSRIGYLNDPKDKDKDSHVINNNEVRNMFQSAKYQEPLNKTDILLIDGDTYHNGGENKSTETRKFLLIQLVKDL
jgi:ectoine hydroxylase-related dioxygenase (phytanoyl-CoA dioxygenase family)